MEPTSHLHPTRTRRVRFQLDNREYFARQSAARTYDERSISERSYIPEDEQDAAMDTDSQVDYPWWVVFVGRHPHLYQTRQEAFAETVGVPGGLYQGFPGLDSAIAAFKKAQEAQMVIERWGIGEIPEPQTNPFQGGATPQLATGTTTVSSPGKSKAHAMSPSPRKPVQSLSAPFAAIQSKGLGAFQTPTSRTTSDDNSTPPPAFPPLLSSPSTVPPEVVVPSIMTSIDHSRVTRKIRHPEANAPAEDRMRPSHLGHHGGAPSRSGTLMQTLMAMAVGAFVMWAALAFLPV